MWLICIHPLSTSCEEAVQYYANEMDLETKAKIDICLEMIKFGMGNTLLTFMDKYYEYGGDKNIENRGLTIGWWLQIGLACRLGCSLPTGMHE